ncbi:MAG: hypothetical protein ACMZI0_00880 [Symbiopectobacterium sp.]|uniref:hypothetical protein n=1 Tax=Symbiopectobacterium sp. TaxID=2952789 RepID=UPI0039E8B0F8
MKKEEYCYRILKTYSLIVDFDGEPHRINVPSPIDDADETLAQWRSRVLGPDATNVVFYQPTQAAPNNRIATLQQRASADHVERMFKSLAKAKDERAEKKTLDKVEKEVTAVKKQLITFPCDTLEEVVETFGDKLEPSVIEFFDRFLEDTGEHIDTESLLKELISTYNSAAKAFREKNQYPISAQAHGKPDAIRSG